MVIMFLINASKGDIGEMMNQFKVTKENSEQNLSHQDAMNLAEETQQNLDKSNIQLISDVEMPEVPIDKINLQKKSK